MTCLLDEIFVEYCPLSFRLHLMYITFWGLLPSIMC